MHSLNHLADRRFTVSNVIELAFAILGRAYLHMFGPMVVAVGSILAVLALGGLMVPGDGLLAVLALLGAVVGVNVTVYAATVAPMVTAASAVDGRRVSAVRALLKATRRVPAVIGLAVLGLAAVVAYGFIVVGITAPLKLIDLPAGPAVFLVAVLAAAPMAFWLLLRCSQALPLVIVERKHPVTAVQRSWQLTRGHVLRLWLLAMLSVGALYATEAVSMVGETAGLVLTLMLLPVGPALSVAQLRLLQSTPAPRTAVTGARSTAGKPRPRGDMPHLRPAGSVDVSRSVTPRTQGLSEG